MTPPARSGGAGGDAALDFLAMVGCGDGQVMRHLKVQPEFRRRAEIARQPQGGVGGDPAPFVDDFPDAGRRHAQSQGQSIASKSQDDAYAWICAIHDVKWFRKLGVERCHT